MTLKHIFDIRIFKENLFRIGGPVFNMNVFEKAYIVKRLCQRFLNKTKVTESSPEQSTITEVNSSSEEVSSTSDIATSTSEIITSTRL